MKFAKAVDNRINLEEPTLVVMESVPSVIYQSIPPSQPSNNPVITIPVAAGMGLSRELLFQAGITFTITGTDLELFQTEQCLSLRAFPINQCLTNLNIQLGTQSVSITPNLYTSAFLQYNNDTFIQRQNQSGTASAVDLVTSYSDIVGTVASPFSNSLDENNNGYGNTCRTKQILSVTPNASTGATSLTVVVNIVEALIASPFTYQGIADPEKAIFNLNNVIVTMSFNYLQRMLSYSIPTGASVTGVSAVFDSQSILCQFIAPFENSLANRTYPTSYNYTYIQSTDTTISNIAAALGSTASISTNTQQLSIIPDYFLIYAIPSVADLTSVSPSYPDFFFPISSINIQIGQRSSVLGSASQFQLWQISKKNGSNVDWTRWSGQQILDSTSTAGTNKGVGGGGVLILSTASDLNLPKTSAVGMAEAQNFQANITITNNTGIAFTNVTIRVVSLTSGYMQTSGQGNIQLVTGGVTPQMLQHAPVISETALRTSSLSKGYSGGGWWNDFKKGFSSVMKPAGQIASALAPIAGEYAPEVGAAGTIFTALGNATGGALIPRSQIRGRMMGYR
jgi:hypothetical protein